MNIFFLREANTFTHFQNILDYLPLLFVFPFLMIVSASFYFGMLDDSEVINNNANKLAQSHLKGIMFKYIN